MRASPDCPDPMDRNSLYRPTMPLLNGEDNDEIAPWEAERLARGGLHSDPGPVNQARLVSARDQEVQNVSSLGQGRRHEFPGQSGEARIFLIQDDNLTAEVPLRRSILQSTLRQKYRSTGRHNPQRDGGPEKGL